MPNFLRTGEVLLVWFAALRPFPKDKFAVLCQIEPSPLFLLINSAINKFVVDTDELKSHHLVIGRDAHSFLDHDSYVDCTATFGYDREQLAAILRKSPERRKGMITDELRNRIIARVNESRQLPPKKQRSIVDGLRSSDPYHFAGFEE